MTATDELRRMLDERGLKYRDYFHANKTWWSGRENVGWCAEDRPSANGMFVKVEAVLTPAQAITATLGSDDAFTREDVEGAFVSGYSLGLDMFDNSKPDNEKGWNQNERDMDEEMEDLGWVRKDAAKLSTGTCRNTAPSYLDFLCSECGFVNYRNDENDSGGGNDWHYCPNCGRKVVDE